MTGVAILLVVATACHHGRVAVQLESVANAAGEVRTAGSAEVDAVEESSAHSLRKTTATIRRDQQLKVKLADQVLTAELRPHTHASYSVHELSLAELLQGCPPGSFAPDNPTRVVFPRCKLFAVPSAGIDVETRRFAPPVWDFVPLATVVGLGACTWLCDSPHSTIAGATLIVTGVVIVAAVVVIVSVANAKR